MHLSECLCLLRYIVASVIPLFASVFARTDIYLSERKYDYKCIYKLAKEYNKLLHYFEYVLTFLFFKI